MNVYRNTANGPRVISATFENADPNGNVHQDPISSLSVKRYNPTDPPPFINFDPSFSIKNSVIRNYENTPLEIIGLEYPDKWTPILNENMHGHMITFEPGGTDYIDIQVIDLSDSRTSLNEFAKKYLLIPDSLIDILEYDILVGDPEYIEDLLKQYNALSINGDFSAKPTLVGGYEAVEIGFKSKNLTDKAYIVQGHSKGFIIYMRPIGDSFDKQESIKNSMSLYKPIGPLEPVPSTTIYEYSKYFVFSQDLEHFNKENFKIEVRPNTTQILINAISPNNQLYYKSLDLLELKDKIRLTGTKSYYTGEELFIAIPKKVP
jgi:hypothetical protein